MDILKFATTYWMQLVITTGTGAVVFILKKGVKIVIDHAIDTIDSHYQEDIAEQKAIKSGVLSLAHFMLYNFASTVEEKGTMTVSECEELDHIYDAYHSLGGNGTGTKIYEQCKKLPIKH